MVRIKKGDKIRVANVLIKVKKCLNEQLTTDYCKCNKKTVHDGYVEDCAHFFCSQCLINKKKCSCKKPIINFKKIYEYF